MARRWFVVLAALRLAVAGYASAVPVDRPAATHHHHSDWDGLARTTIPPGAKRGELIMEFPAVDPPAGAMARQPASVGEFPVDGSIYAVRAEIVDRAGRQLPIELLHHMNVMDPNERELFLPISRRILASGGETGEIRMPWLFVGSPFRAGEHVLAYAMVHNPTPVGYEGVRVRLVLDYVPAGRPWPVLSVVPWQLDVAFPVGDKSFDLPPGTSERSYEGSPAVAGKLLVIGAHMHAYGRSSCGMRRPTSCSGMANRSPLQRAKRVRYRWVSSTGSPESACGSRRSIAIACGWSTTIRPARRSPTAEWELWVGCSFRIAMRHGHSPIPPRRYIRRTCNTSWV